MCQLEAREAEQILAPALRKMGAKLVVVSHQLTGLGDFQASYFQGEVYLDERKAFFEALGNRFAQHSDIKLAEVRAAGKAALKALKAADPDYQLSSAGEGALLGGSFVFAARSGQILFTHRERVFGDVAKPAEILAACKQARL